MPVRKRNPRIETLGVTVSIEAKRFVEQEAAMRNASVSEFLRPGVILGLVQSYLGLTLDEAVVLRPQNRTRFGRFLRNNRLSSRALSQSLRLKLNGGQVPQG